MNSVKELREAVTELVRLLDVVLRKDHFSRDDEDSFSWYEMKEKFNLNEENSDEA